MIPGKGDSTLSLKTSTASSPGHERQREAPKTNINSKSSTSLAGGKEDYFTADELSDEDAQLNDDDSWWYSDAKAPESKYDEWYYLVCLPSMRTSGPNPSSRRRYRGMFNPSKETQYEPVVEDASAGTESGDESSRHEQHSYDRLVMPSENETISGNTFAQKPSCNVDFVDWDKSNGSASVCSSCPETSPRSIPLEWDDFDEPETLPTATESTDGYWPWVEPPLEVVHEDLREFQCNPDLGLPFQFLKEFDASKQNNFTEEKPDEKTYTSNNPFITTPESELKPPRRHSPLFPFSNHAVSSSPNLIEASPESFNPFLFPPPSPSDSGPHQQSNDAIQFESKTKSWIDVLKSEMAELSRSCSESQYFDMPWVHSKLPPLSFSSDSQDEEDTEAELEPKHDKSARRFTPSALSQQCKSSIGI